MGSSSIGIFDLGVSQAEHPEVFAAYPSESEGKTDGERCDGISAGTTYDRKIAPIFIYNVPVNMQAIY